MQVDLVRYSIFQCSGPMWCELVARKYVKRQPFTALYRNLGTMWKICSWFLIFVLILDFRLDSWFSSWFLIFVFILDFRFHFLFVFFLHFVFILEFRLDSWIRLYSWFSCSFWNCVFVLDFRVHPGFASSFLIFVLILDLHHRSWFSCSFLIFIFILEFRLHFDFRLCSWPSSLFLTFVFTLKFLFNNINNFRLHALFPFSFLIFVISGNICHYFSFWFYFSAFDITLLFVNFDLRALVYLFGFFGIYSALCGIVFFL